MRNKHTIFKIISFILLLSFLLSFSACTQKEEEGVTYDFSAYFGDYEDSDYVEELIDRYASETGIHVKAIFRGRDTSMSAILVTEGAYDGYTPMQVAGYGFAVDKKFIKELVGEENADNFIADLKVASYDEWSQFTFTLSSYINETTAGKVVLNGNTYEMATEKSALIKSANGVFAVAGADREYYGDRILNVAIRNTSFSALEDVETTVEGITILTPPLNNYIVTLDMITARMAGVYEAAVRGNDFTSENYYSYEIAKQIFMNDKAAFIIVESSEYEELYELNALKATRLEFIPIKVKNMKADEIPAQVNYSIGLNEGINDDSGEAKKFLDWYVAQYKENENPLELSVCEYLTEGKTFRYTFENDAYEDWKDVIFGEGALEEYLKMSYWGDFGHDLIVRFMAESWFNK